MAMNFVIPLALGALQGLQNKKKGQSTGNALLGGALGGMGMTLPSRAAEVASMGAAPMNGVLGQPVQLGNSLNMLRGFGGMM